MTYDLDRFLKAQELSYDAALAELAAGEKRSHWIWYIFPQLKGLGRSWNSEFYGIDGFEEAREYLKHPILGPRLRECCQAVLDVQDKDIESIMSSTIDAMKLKSSMTLFDAVSPEDIFKKVLEKYFDGRRSHRTLSILEGHRHPQADE